MWGLEFQPAFAGAELDADYWIIKAEGKSIGRLQRSTSGGQPHAGTRLYFEVPDLEEALAQIEVLGGQIERGRTELGGDDRWFATALDPTGVSFGVWTAHPATVGSVTDK